MIHISLMILLFLFLLAANFFRFHIFTMDREEQLFLPLAQLCTYTHKCIPVQDEAGAGAAALLLFHKNNTWWRFRLVIDTTQPPLITGHLSAQKLKVIFSHIFYRLALCHHITHTKTKNIMYIT